MRACMPVESMLIGELLMFERAIELAFFDIKHVVELLNTGPNSPQVREAIASAIARALIAAL